MCFKSYGASAQWSASLGGWQAFVYFMRGFQKVSILYVNYVENYFYIYIAVDRIKIGLLVANLPWGHGT